MAGKLASLLIKISADGASAEKELRSLEKKMTNLAKEFEKVGKTLTKNVTAPLTALAGLSVAAANTQLQAEAKLLNALQGREDVQQRLIAQAGELQSRTTLGDEAIIEQQAFLAALGLSEKQIGDTIEAAAQLSAALNMDLGSAVKNLAKTYGGMTGELGEGIPALKELTTEQLKAGEAVKFVNENYKGFAETAADTGAGPLVQLKNALGDLAEQFGVILLPAVQKLSSWLKDIVTKFQNLSPTAKTVIVVIGALAAAIGPLLLVISKLIASIAIIKLAMPALKIAMAGMLGPISAVVAAVVALAAAWLSAKSAHEKYVRQAAENTKQVREEFGQETYNRIYEEFSRPIYDDARLLRDLDYIRKRWKDIKGGGEGHTPEEIGDLNYYYLNYEKALVDILNQRKKAREDAAAIENQAKENANELTEAFLDQTDAIEDELGLMGSLQAKISKLEKSRLAAQTEEEVKRINFELAKTKAELERISALGEQTPISLSKQDALDGLRISDEDLLTLKPVDFGETNLAPQKMSAYWQAFADRAKRAGELIDSVTQVIGSALANLATTIGEGLGNLLSGLDVDPGKALLEVLGNSLKSLGAALVTYATTMQAFKDSLKRVFLDPWSAILLGTGAIALGQLFVNMAKEPIKLASGGLAYGPTLAVVGDNRGAASDPEVIAPLSKLRNYMGGQQLELVGGVTFELRGDVARAIINRENVRLNRKG